MRRCRTRSHRGGAAVAGLALVAALGLACTKQDAGVQTSSPTASPTSTTGGAPKGGDAPGTTAKPKGAGLGGFVKPEATPAFLSKVAQQTRAANTGTFSLTIVVDGASGTSGHVPLIDLSGSYDKDNSQSHLKIDLSGVVAAAPDAAAADGVDPTLFGQPVEIVQDGDTEYFKIAAMEAVLGSGWIKSSGDTNQSAFAELFDLFKVDDISGFLETMQASGSVREVGKEDLDKVPVIHYHADIDPSQLDTSKNAGAGKLLSSFEGATSAAVEVWVDGQALVRKLTVSADAGALGSDLGATYSDGTAVLTMGLSGLGQPVDIPIPSPDQITDLSGVDLGGLGTDPSGATTTTAAGDAPAVATTDTAPARIDN